MAPRFALFLICLPLVGAALLTAAKSAEAEQPSASRRFDLPDEARRRLLIDFRRGSADERVAALRRLRRFAHPDAADLLLSKAFGDRSENVRTAADEVLRSYRDRVEVARFLHEHLAKLAGGDRITRPFDVMRLMDVLAEYHAPSAVSGILRYRRAVHPAVADHAVRCVMSAVDRRSDAQDSTLPPILVELAQSRLFARHFGFRRCVVEAAIRLRTPAAVTFLIDQLDRLEGRLKHDAAAHLRRLSGKDLGGRSAAWSAWWNRHRRSFQFPEQLPEPPPDGPEVPRYYNVAVHAKRLVFVLDVSGSMKQGGATTRLDAAKHALLETIRSLPEDRRFGILVFNHRVISWQPKLIAATEKNKHYAAQFVRLQQPGGQTASYDALMAAFLLDPQVETIFFLSDGEPSAGAVVDPKQILKTLARTNHIRRITIHSIGVLGRRPPEKLEEFLKGLAEKNWGKYLRAD